MHKATFWIYYEFSKSNMAASSPHWNYSVIHYTVKGACQCQIIWKRFINVSLTVLELLLFIQVTWLVVTKVWSQHLGLVTERHHYNARPIYAWRCYVKPVLVFIV